MLNQHLFVCGLLLVLTPFLVLNTYAQPDPGDRDCMACGEFSGRSHSAKENSGQRSSRDSRERGSHHGSRAETSHNQGIEGVTHRQQVNKRQFHSDNIAPPKIDQSETGRQYSPDDIREIGGRSEMRATPKDAPTPRQSEQLWQNWKAGQ